MFNEEFGRKSYEAIDTLEDVMGLVMHHGILIN